jgi:hypothetical protein
MVGHIAARRATPSDDLLSELIVATDAERRQLLHESL